MAVYGIIAEYNPFHNGHLYQLNKIREFDNDAKIIVVMSGSFTQRGSLAILDKWQRAESAVKNGVDLVIELPAVFALRSAQFFAEGAIRLLSDLQIVDQLVFGIEANNLSDLEAVVDLQASPEFDSQLQSNLSAGFPYAAAVSQALLSFDSQTSADIIKEPNNILAIEYLKALRHFHSSIKPFAVKRVGVQHNDITINGSFASASAIRSALSAGDFSKVQSVVPADVFEVLQQRSKTADIPSIDNLYRSLLTSIYNLTATELQSIYGINEGLENAVLEAARNCQSISGLTEKISCRRYPLSRIRRLLDYILLGWHKDAIDNFTRIGPQYIRVLAFNKTGQDLLHSIKQNSSLPIITKVSNHLNSKQIFSQPLNDLQMMLAFDVKATDVYNLAFSSIKNAGNDQLISPRVI